MIYCVVPRELESEMYDTLVKYYAGNEKVTVVVDRRQVRDRRRESSEVSVDNRQGRRRETRGGGFVSTDVRDP